MKNKKYEFTGETKNFYGVTLKQIRALVNIIGVVSSGEVGGWIEHEKCLDQSGNAWVSGNAKVSGNAWVSGNAKVSGDAMVYGIAQVYGDALVYGNAQVYGDALVSGDVWVYGNAKVSGNAWVSGNALVYGNAKVYGDAKVSGDVWVSGNALVESKESICLFSGFGSEYRTTTAFFDEKINIRIICGCFTGSLTEFREQVKQTHGDSKNGKLYMQMANMIEYRLSTEE